MRTDVVLRATTFLLAFSLTGGLSAQSKRSDGPRMEIEPQEHDFGAVSQDQKLVHEFVVLNTGSDSLEIRRISTSCGCTAAITSASSVPPGGTAKLRVILETRKYTGVLERSVSLATNDPRRVHTVRVKAFVEPRDDAREASRIVPGRSSS